MARILNYYALCPINDVDEFLGLSQGAETGTIINTLGRNIISNVKVRTHNPKYSHLNITFNIFIILFSYIYIQLSNQKQINSWTSVDKFTNKVIYDSKLQQYVGIFANRWIRCWSEACTDISKVKKIKVCQYEPSLLDISSDH